ncbi:MAG: carboxypeptidase-like regulatory domain-containing protein, partial [Thermoguttaceae bacterium]|nr:carboxypeptidase-like regulatory domain-containing protein [Thermoguttaceae bacterium]
MHRLLLALAITSGPLLVLSAFGTGAESSETAAGWATTCIRGCVVDENGPVRDARVGVRGSPRRVVTDARGQFALPTHGVKAP